ncbi:P-loop containing nucleoside triphosphate hydrolases superfamily protein [Arabidopsis thaliana]|uniref:Kinesin-like protein KIN-14P n=2 Tax=Arabidopsis thaliana TaxID=3702 RepID=KN14P_ARATH|nr:P-loop containing nucleoside triphosphate hydrolases superfamily protein [Arabidopsis thaliana]Q0WN69.1 RecName: Full=Kinesin-like protein KIN-14P [Arabidopsis thaliana]AEE35517.1 P-loop containing nucleoside triphosphate hydrolases superfamily protein [Arabidopsis thaliana]BAF01431.1 kinesin-related protein [Arabidopsis thaliana]|eukprot:NP_177527.3 P-loop containing nucleoside triphosphate hydrolases superfamily protein [Arabidopsis thaliana]
MNPMRDQPGSPYGDSTPRSPFSPFSPLSVDDRHRNHADTKTPRSPFSPFSPLSGDERHKSLAESKFQQALASSGQLDPLSPGSMHHGGHKFHEVFQMKQGRYDLQASKISEMMKSSSLDNAPTQSLLSVLNGILDESIERKNGEIPQRVACLLRKVVQEIERRISTQAEHLRTQNNIFKTREEKYQSRINVLEALASGTGVEHEIATQQLRQIETEKSMWEEKKKHEEEDMVKLMKQNDQHNLEISALKQELETTKRKYEQQYSQIESQTKTEKSKWEEQKKNEEEDMDKLLKENDQFNLQISALRQELETTRKAYEQQCSQMESQTMVATTGLESRLKELEQEGKVVNTAKNALEERVKELEQMGKEAHSAKNALEEKIKQLQQMEKETKTANTSLEGKIQELEQNLVMWKTKVREMEKKSESNHQRWSQKELSYKSFIDNQSQALLELRSYSRSIKQEILKVQENYTDQFSQLGKKLIELSNAAENYHAVLTENRKLFNELQELKGNIRVFCRVRPFLPAQGAANTVVEYVGEDGELVVTNPTRPGKDGLRQFKFNKVYSPTASQADVFSDIRPLVRSVLDGYNVCIFAYGQTGSGKTYTMTGPDGSSEEDWGVNYRALNDLFKISQSRKGNISYEVGVQMVEIYNEQVLDLLSDDNSQKKTLGILSTTQQNGLAVPDASMYPVTSTSDVITLMDIGLQNRAVGSTALNERSSRSHSIVTVHVRGKDLKTGSVLYGNLHLVDLAGSERVDRSEVTGDRLREAQHINKSLSSLGDVIFSLASKSSHVPYRNSKLTQLLQTSLGGRAKTLMFVQLNPDATSYSESMSTLKFAERVSGVELGAAKTSKEGKDVRDLMEQLASLKDTIARKDEEIERLQHQPQRLQKSMMRRKSIGHTDDINSDTGEYSSQSRYSVTDGESLASSAEAEYDERLSEITSDAASMGTQGSIDVTKRPPRISDRAKSVTAKSSTSVTRPLDKLRKVATRTTSTVAKVTGLTSSSKGLASSSIKKTGSTSSLAKSSKRWA